MRRATWLIGFVLVCSVTARADILPEELRFETDGTYAVGGESFEWQFGGDRANGFTCGELTSGSGETFPDFGELRAAGEQVCAPSWQLAFGDRGFVMDPTGVEGACTVTRQVFVPDAGGDFARWADRIDNPGAEDASLELEYRGLIGWGGPFGDWVPCVDSSSGDLEVGTDDVWAVFDADEDGEGAPATAVVWQSEAAPVRATGIELDFELRIRFDEVTVPAGGRATLLLFAVQANTRAEAAAMAADLADLAGAATEHLDDDAGSLANFAPAQPGAPRVTWNGPFAVSEGGEVVVQATAEDPEGEAMTFEWDLDDDGDFDDLSGTLDAPVSAEDRDGPATLRLGLRATDETGHATVSRTSVAVRNVEPVVSSSPATTARTGEAFSYQIVAIDYAGDVLRYEILVGPPGLAVGGTGLVSWTPAADGLGPDVPVSIAVTDDDGGATTQRWTIGLAGAPHVRPGGPYAVDEGREVVLTPIVSDPEGDAMTIRWDLDADGAFDDAEGPTATWSAAGVDGPAEDVGVGVEVSDGELDARTSIPVRVRNAPPEFLSTPPAEAVVDREWVYAIDLADPGGDEIAVEIEGEGAPARMVLEGRTLRWTPVAPDLETGTFGLAITATDEDGGRSRQEVTITVREDAPPPAPSIQYPDGTEPVRIDRPTIILENVDDPDGDPVEYFLQIDSNDCFCSPDLQSSGPIAEGDLVTLWTPPLALPVADHTTWYVRRWTSDGLLESPKLDSLFEYAAPPLDEPSGLDEVDEGERAGCACRTAGVATDRSAVASLAAIVGLALVARLRRR